MVSLREKIYYASQKLCRLTKRKQREQKKKEEKNRSVCGRGSEDVNEGGMRIEKKRRKSKMNGSHTFRME